MSEINTSKTPPSADTTMYICHNQMYKYAQESNENNDC